MLLNGLDCEVLVDRKQLEHLSEFRYLVWVLDESGTDEAVCCRVVAGAIRSLVNVRNLQLQCAMVFHETLFVAVLMYGSKTAIK